MLSPEAFFVFFVSSLSFAYMPGPALVYAAAQTISRGRRAGLIAALGIHVGGYTHVFAVALGVAVILDKSPQLFTVIKLLGVGYLIWLGLRLLLTTKSVSLETSGGANGVFWTSVIVEVFNPATAIFFLAFLPQFVNLGAEFPVWIQLVILGAVVNAIFSSVELLCVLLSSQIMQVLCVSSGTGTRFQRAGGVLLVALGLNLMVNY